MAAPDLFLDRWCFSIGFVATVRRGLAFLPSIASRPMLPFYHLKNRNLFIEITRRLIC